MVGVIFATPDEAAPFLARYRNGRFRQLRADDVAEDGDVLVALTGVGKIRAALRTEHLTRTHALSHLVHAGGCTALAPDLAVGAVVGVTHVLEGDRSRDIEVSAYPRMPLDLPFDAPHAGTLVTQDRGVYEDDERAYWQRLADVGDSTGYAVAYAAARRGVACTIAKAVAGRAGEPSDDVPGDRRAAHEASAAFVLDALAKLLPDEAAS
jgi:nucleoside phosphorylase